MIRMVLLGVGFVAVTVALVVIQPGAKRSSRGQSVPEPVTRAEPAQVALPVAPVHVPEPMDQALGYPAAIAPATRRDPVPVAPSAVSSTTGLDDAQMRRMTWDALSGLNQATGRDSAPGQPGSLLHTIMRRSLDGAPVSPVAGSPADVSPRVYVVQQGDSLVSIAERVYGDVNMTGPLFAANQSQLQRPDDLRPGQTLVLPTN